MSQSAFDPAAIAAIHDTVALLALGVGAIALGLLFSALVFAILWLASWVCRRSMRLSSRWVGLPLAIPEGSFSFTLLSGFAGWTILPLDTIFVGFIQNPQPIVLSTNLLVILLVMVLGVAVYALVRGLLGQPRLSTSLGAA